jgi:hypothetical protein
MGLIHEDVAICAALRSAATTMPLKVPTGLDCLLLLCRVKELDFKIFRREGSSCRKDGEKML